MVTQHGWEQLSVWVCVCMCAHVGELWQREGICQISLFVCEDAVDCQVFLFLVSTIIGMIFGNLSLCFSFSFRGANLLQHALKLLQKQCFTFDIWNSISESTVSPETRDRRVKNEFLKFNFHKQICNSTKSQSLL